VSHEHRAASATRISVDTEVLTTTELPVVWELTRDDYTQPLRAAGLTDVAVIELDEQACKPDASPIAVP